ncbi:serpin family protein [soil metagenome]
MIAIPRRQFLRAAAIAPLLPMLGCSSNTANVPPDETLVPLTPASGDGINAFAFDLYGKLADDKANRFLSPYSISTALAMTAAGSKGATREQMAKVLHLPEDLAASGEVYRSLAAAVTGQGKPYALSVANAIWAQQGYPWAESYLTVVKTVYHAAVNDCDFMTDAEKERLRINAWVEQQTNDKIKELLAKGILTVSTRMVLTNAIYFKGDWAAAFKKEHTQNQPFTNLDGSKKNVPLMYRTGGDSFTNDTVQMIRLTYKGNDLSFLAILPRKAEDFAKVEKSLTRESLATWSKGLHHDAELQLWLPRFKVETEYSLKEPLQSLGMVDVFDEVRANFDGMVSTPPAGLSISAVVHKAFVDVNEAGTEAAAATGVVFKEFSDPGEPTRFRADRPFLFAIRHEASGALLFLGRVAKL